MRGLWPHRKERPSHATVRKRLRWVNSRLNEALVPLNAELSHNADGEIGPTRKHLDA